MEASAWVVVRTEDTDERTILSAHADRYDAKFEAARLEERDKKPHDFVPGKVTIE